MTTQPATAPAPASPAPPGPSPWGRRTKVILWPALLMASVLEALVFVWVDPAQLRWFGDTPLDLSPTAVHTLAFLLFWGRDCHRRCADQLAGADRRRGQSGLSLDSLRR